MEDVTQNCTFVLWLVMMCLPKGLVFLSKDQRRARGKSLHPGGSDIINEIIQIHSLMTL